MKRRYWVIIVVLVALVFSTTAGWATTVYWRNNSYQLPGYYQSTVISSILTDHKRDLDRVVAAVEALTLRVASLERRMTAAEADIVTNAADIATNETDIATNATDIATNAADISSNTSAISSHVSNTTTAHHYDARYVRTSDTTERTITGAVLSSGSIFGGAGFTVTKNGTGDYTVDFGTSFSGNVRAVACVFDGRRLDTVNITNSGMQILIDSPDGSARADESFMFVVSGR